MNRHELLVTRRPDKLACRVTHPLSRQQCVIGMWSHDLHWTRDTGVFWNTVDGKSSSPVGAVYVTYFGRFVPHPGHEADQAMEHFPDPIILRNEVACRITHGYGTTFAPGAAQRPVRYQEVSPLAYMDVWILASPDHGVLDPVPAWDSQPMERWSLRADCESHRAAYLPVVAP
jgi:hypothetical protein